MDTGIFDKPAKWTSRNRTCCPLPPMIQYTHAMRRELMIMAKFIPKGKLSKKAQKELNRQRRVTWEFSPVTKTFESKKLYNRKKNSCDRYEDYGIGVFQFSV